MGGSGKTRLALELGARREAQGDRVELVDLSSLSSPDDVGFALSEQLGARSATDPVAAAMAEIGVASILLIVDNCEQVLEAAADAVTRVLTGCPGAVVLATSR